MCTNHAARNVPAYLGALWVFAVMLAPRDVEGSVVSRSREGVTKKCDLGSPPPQGFNNCTTKACENARLVLANMDLCHPPCDDFYKFACGNTKVQRRMPDVVSKAAQLTVLGIKVMNNMQLLLSEPVTEKDSRPTKVVKVMYQSCLDASDPMKIATLIESMKKLVSDLGGWPSVVGPSWDGSKFDWRNQTYKLRDYGQNFQVFFKVMLGGIKDSAKNQLYVEPNGPPELKGNKDEVSFKSNLILTIAKLLGADENVYFEDLKQVTALEKQLNMIFSTKSKLASIMTIAEMNNHFPSVNWNEYLNNILKISPRVADHYPVFSLSPETTKQLLQQLSKTDPRTLANYMVVNGISILMGLKKNAGGSKFGGGSNSLIDDLSSELLRSCFLTIFNGRSPINLLSPALASMYVKRYFDKNLIPPVKAMIKNVQNSLKDIFNATSWMDRNTAKVTIEKVDAMKVMVGYPDELMNETKLDEFYSGFDFKEGEFFDNYNQLQRKTKSYEFSKLWGFSNEFDWITMSRSAEVNAFYMPFNNAFIVNAAILQDIFFDCEKSDFMNYGTMGSIIGHEISHGFDSKGIQYDKTGIYRDWWPTDMTEKFKTRSQCFVEQYNKYVEQGQGEHHVDGEKTLGENLADHGGVLAAYSAYVKMAEQRGETEPGLPGLETLSPRQMFWVSFAQPWCGRFTKRELDLEYNNEHSPSHWRVVGVVSNSEQFSRDFNCPPNSKMNPEKKCHMWQ